MKKHVWVLLIVLSLFAAALNFIPRLNYEYPLHVDEYVHWQYANHLSNNAPLYFGQEYGNNLEAGFHYLLAVLNSMGISYLMMFKFFPMLITILICLGVFVLTRRMFGENAGLFAVLFIALLKSNAMILGPALLVPMSIGLFLIAIGLYLVKINSNAWILILSSLLIIHPPSALAFFVLINISLLGKIKEYPKKILMQVLAGLIALPLYIPTFMARGVESIDSLAFTQIISPVYVPSFLGWCLAILGVIGVYFALENRRYHLPIGIIVLLAFIILFYQFKIEVFLPYARTLMYLFLIFAVVFGLGCSKIIGFGKSNRIKLIIAIVLAGLILFTSLPAKLESNNYFYHIADDKDYGAYSWIKDNSDKNAIAVLDPWKANAFTPIAERAVYSRIVQGPSEESEGKNKEVDEFFKDNCTDYDFLARNNISVVYGNCENSNLFEVYDGAYLFNSYYVSRVIDGDTFELSSGEKARLICVDTPESGEKGYMEAKEFLNSLILGKRVHLEKDVSERDAYGRLLRYAYIDGLFVNKEIVKQGYASVFRYGNDTAKCDEIES